MVYVLSIVILQAIEEAYVPLIKMTVDGIEVWIQETFSQHSFDELYNMFIILEHQPE